MEWIDNSRTLTGWQGLLHLNGLTRYRWARKLIGGRWEQWWVDVVYSLIWHPVNQPGTYANRPAPICRPDHGVRFEVWPSR